MPFSRATRSDELPSSSSGSSPLAFRGAFAVVGAAAFLVAAQRMPVTATVLALEFTRVSHDALFPVLFAVSGAAAAGLACARWEAGRRSAGALS